MHLISDARGRSFDSYFWIGFHVLEIISIREVAKGFTSHSRNVSHKKLKAIPNVDELENLFQPPRSGTVFASSKRIAVAMIPFLILKK